MVNGTSDRPRQNKANSAGWPGPYTTKCAKRTQFGPERQGRLSSRACPERSERARGLGDATPDGSSCVKRIQSGAATWGTGTNVRNEPNSRPGRVGTGDEGMLHKQTRSLALGRSGDRRSRKSKSCATNPICPGRMGRRGRGWSLLRQTKPIPGAGRDEAQGPWDEGQMRQTNPIPGGAGRGPEGGGRRARCETRPNLGGPGYPLDVRRRAGTMGEMTAVPING
jgi:hypothetical protein